ncbi:MAG TPA: RsmD family RNA methyltransferase [Niabella sp.]|nr:RsmD family RNA methyltransferase [Chitinophagaceae bacterium]HRO84665.1 RsmD family RNA methyltransferase [Niabella sp.]
MRIITGKYGGRKINPPAKMPYTRPTTDVAKEGLFNVMQHRLDFEGMKTLDLFGGTGSITYELASRGAEDLTIVEKDTQMFEFIKKTANTLMIENIKFIKMDVFKFMEGCHQQYDFIFAGPPYALSTIDELPKIIIEKGLLKPGGWFVLEHTPRNDYKAFEKYSFEKNYGTTIFSVFVNE